MSGTLIFGQNRTTNTLHAVEVDTTGVVAVDIHAGGTGSGDLKARTDIADPASSTFLKCNADGTLDISVAIDETGLATDANQTNGNQITKCMGSEDGSTTGTQRQFHVDGSGNVLVKEVGTVNVAPSNDTNSGITNDPTNSVAVGLRARTTIGDATTETFLKCDASGVLEVSSSGGGDATAANQVLQLAQETTTATQTTATASSVASMDGKITICDTGAVGITSNTDPTKATSTNQVLQLAQETTTATQTTATASSVASMDGKITICDTGAVGITSNTDPTKATSTNQSLQLAQETTTATQTTATASSVASMDGKITTCNTGAVAITSNTDPTKATSTLQTAGNASLAIVAGAVSGTEFQCDVVSSVLPSGASTSANQSLQLAQETSTANNTLSIDGKITQGYDSTVASGGNGLQQIVCYGLDNAGDLDALRVDSSGHLEITVDDFVKGQATMANSFPVVIASDQSAVATSSAQLPTSLGQKANSGSLSICRSTTAGAFDLSARTTIATAGTSTKLLCDTSGVLQIQPLRDAVSTAISTTNVLANGTFDSSTVDMNEFSELMVIGNTTNTSDSMYWAYSFDNITFYKGSQLMYDFSTGDFAAQPNNGAGVGGARYIRITQTDTTTTAFTVQFGSSKR